MSEETQLDKIESMLRRLLSQTAPRAPSEDETVGRNPSEKYWQGANYKGCRLSECPVDFLRAYAKYRSACSYAARKNDSDKPEKMKYAEKDERTAKLATAWSDYLEATDPLEKRERRSLPAPVQEEEEAPLASGNGDDDIPF